MTPTSHDAAGPDLAPAEAAERPTRYAWYVAVVLMLAYTLSYVDRKMPFILVESIKADLSLSDTQIGLLTGVMFALIYAVAGIPLGALADRRSRKRLMGWAILFWSGLTALGGLAANFWQLALSRAGVAAGEAACTPAAHSLIADYFPRSFRARAMGLYIVGSPVGALLGLGLGGWINEISNWRIAMFMFGLPGVLLALLIFFTIKEPPRSKDHMLDRSADTPSMWDAIKIFVRQPALRHLFIAMTLTGTTASAFQGFAPAYIIRTFELGTAEVGLTYGFAFGVAGVIGTLLSGVLADWLRKSSQWKAIAMLAVATSIGTPAVILGLLADDYLTFLLCMSIMQIGYVAQGAPAFATIQGAVSPRMHAVSSAILLIGISGIGVSVGPLLTGLLSDALSSLGPERSLRWGLIILAIPNLWAAGHFLMSAAKLRAMDRRPQAEAPGVGAA